jgi:hypothetical protein
VLTDDEDIPAPILAYGALRAAMQLQVQALGEIVSEFGVVMSKPDGSATTDEAGHDFLVYCVARCFRMTRAVTVLFDALLPDETYPLSRSIYEHYLALACVLRSPRFLDEFLIKPIGLYSGTLVHPVSRKGTPIRRTIVRPATGQVYSGSMSIRELAYSTGYKWDGPLHEVLYPHLSEHVHPNMLASGDYRDASNTRYAVDSTSSMFKASFWACLASTLATAEARKAVGRSAGSRLGAAAAAQFGNDALLEGLTVLGVTGRYSSLPPVVAKRLRGRKQAWPDQT